jgi:glycosyltransferase involved in cell wall biosynthesis
MAPGKEQSAPRSRLAAQGWSVVDPASVCADLESYREYIESSKAEWSVAKNAYVRGRSGWFSERSACYLAAGRPVVVQDTGFSSILPVGEGLLTFTDVEGAAAAIREVEADYPRHARAARAIAEAYFDSDKVLTRLIEESAR